MKSRILFLIILTTLISCDGLLPSFSKKEKYVTFLSKQYYLVGQDLFYSNGKDVYCDFKSWDHLKKFRGDLKGLDKILKYAKHPTGMIYVGKCDQRYDK